MKLGEVSPGGVGVGLNGLLVLVILSVFIAGLMVGRTPEYLGKKIQAAEVKLVAHLHPGDAARSCSCFIADLDVRAIGVRTSRSSTRARTASRELLYAFTSAGNNNGSAFAGLTANTAVHEHHARPSRCSSVASSSSSRRWRSPARSSASGACPRRSGTFPTDTPLFVVLVIGVIVVVAALTFLPVLALGPIVEQLGL